MTKAAKSGAGQPEEPAQGSMASPGGSTCPRCGTAFECGAKAGAATCWCFNLPPVTPSGSTATCLCPACLAALAAEQAAA